MLRMCLGWGCRVIERGVDGGGEGSLFVVILGLRREKEDFKMYFCGRNDGHRGSPKKQ